MNRLLVVSTLIVSIAISGYASNPPAVELVGTFDLSQLPAGNKNSSAVLIAFVSETSIAIGLCPKAWTGCALSLLRRDGPDLRPYASTPHFRGGEAMHVSSNGQILITPFAGDRTVLFSPDLSATQELPNIFVASQSGNIGADLMKDGWKLYRITSSTEFIREGKGSLRSVSDEVVVFQDGNLMRVESIQGASLGSFSVKPEQKCYNLAYPLSSNTLYFDDCRKVRVVTFDGKQRTELHLPHIWRTSQLWSSNGTRILFDNFDRRVSVIRNIGEGALAVGTLGSGVADQKDNHEEVKVLDTNSGNSCFDWKRSYPMGKFFSSQDAAISPTGEFVAIATDGTLRLYRLPEVCTGSR